MSSLLKSNVAVATGTALSRITGLVRVAVLGAGGVARAMAVGLADEGARVVVFNRTPERA